MESIFADDRQINLVILKDQRIIRRDETVVICITGSGLKTTELFGVRDGHRLQLGKARASDFVRALAEVENAPAVLA